MTAAILGVVRQTPLAFLDLDDTLISTDSNTLWLQWRLRQRHDYRGLPELLVGLHNVRYYRRGALTDTMMAAYYRARTLGLSPERYEAMANRCFEEWGERHIHPEGRLLVEALKDRGSHVVIITGQDEHLTRPFARNLGVHDYIANRRIMKGRRFGALARPNCYREGKIALAGEYAAARGLSLAECSFYSDSISDLPLLEAVGHPVAINPDPALSDMAKLRNWPVVRFAERS